MLCITALISDFAYLLSASLFKYFFEKSKFIRSIKGFLHRTFKSLLEDTDRFNGSVTEKLFWLKYISYLFQRSIFHLKNLIFFFLVHSSSFNVHSSVSVTSSSSSSSELGGRNSAPMRSSTVTDLFPVRFAVRAADRSAISMTRVCSRSSRYIA